MASDNDNIFATGTSGPESNAPNGDGKPAARLDGTEGRIDPVAARNSGPQGDPTGAGSGAGSIGPTGSTASASRNKGGWPKGKPRGKRTDQPAVEQIAEKENRALRAGLIERLLLTAHTVAHAVTKIPELELDQSEAKEVGQAVAAVLKMHNVMLTPEQEAYYNLVEVLGTVYGLRAVTYAVRMQAQKVRGNKPPATVTKLHLRPVPQETGPFARPQAAPPPPPEPEFVAPPQTVNADALKNFDPFNITIENG